MTYSALIEEIQKLPFEDKIQLKVIIDNYLKDERRNQILINSQNAFEDAEKGELIFSSDINELKKMFDD